MALSEPNIILEYRVDLALVPLEIGNSAEVGLGCYHNARRWGGATAEHKRHASVLLNARKNVAV